MDLQHFIVLVGVVAISVAAYAAGRFLLGGGGVDFSAEGRKRFPRGGGSSRDADFGGGGASGRWQQGGGGASYKAFLERLDGEALVAALCAVRQTTTGEVRVSVTAKCPAKDATFTEAMRHFRRLGLHRTQHRSGVLIFIAPRAQEFAVVADEGIQGKCGAAPWRRASAQMREAFERGDFATGLATAIDSIGQVLGARD